MSLKEPKITVVTVCYNAQTSIEETIKSVLSQTYANIEYWIIDGGSTDNTLSIIQKYEKMLHYICEPDSGIFDAMNKGINKATGDWIVFMNAGDVFVDEDTVQKVYSQEYALETGVIHGLMYWGNTQHANLLRMIPFYSSKKKLRGMGMSHQAIFTRTALAKKYLFDLSFKVAADYDMMMRIYKDGWNFCSVDTPIVVYDVTGYSARNAMLQLREVSRICQMEHTFSYFTARMLLSIKQLIKKLLKL